MESFSVPSFWMYGWDKVAPVSKDTWFKIGSSLAAHAESLTEVRRQNLKNGMTRMRCGMLPGSLVISRHSITQRWVPSNLGYSVILSYSRLSPAEWRSLSQAQAAWQHVPHEIGHGHGHVLTDAGLCLGSFWQLRMCPIKSLTHVFAKLCSCYCPCILLEVLALQSLRLRNSLSLSWRGQ